MSEYPTTFPADGPISLRIKQRAGNVFVAATDTDRIHLDVRAANSRSDSEDLVGQTKVDFSPGSLSVDVPRGVSLGFGSTAVDVVLTVPTGTVANIETGSGDVQLRGAFGDVSATSGSGEIVAERVADGRFSTGSGDVRVGMVTSGRVKTGSGDVRVEGADHRLTVDTGSGDVTVGMAAPSTTVKVASGDIKVGESGGVLDLKSASGDVAVSRASEGEVTVTTSSGDIVVGVVNGTAALLDCSTVSGRVVSELDSADAPDDDDRRLRVVTRSASGSVIIRRP